MDRLFLDANVLFSAAYRPGAPLSAFWRLPGVHLLTSGYAAAEARRNLVDADARLRLASLLAPMEIVSETSDPTPFSEAEILPDKDRPILAAAIHASATHLVTGDQKHFGPLYGRRVGTLQVIRPADYLRGRRPPAE